jgi:hypothetical protein
MPETSTGRTARMRRREAFWNNVSLLIGSAAVVAIIAAVVLVATQHMMRPPLADAQLYGEMAVADTRQRQSWSGDATQTQSVFESTRGNRQLKPQIPDSPATLPSQNVAATPAPAVAVPMPAPSPSTSLNEIDMTPPKAIPVLSGIENIEQKRSTIMKALAAFFEAKDVSAKLPYVRNPERVKPLMENFYGREPMPAFTLRDIGKMARLDERGYRFGYVQALFEDATPASLLVEEDDAGQFRIDWESLVRYGELSWKDFLSMHPVDPKLMRLIASRPTDPTMASRPDMVELRHPLESGTILGSFDRNDPKYASLVEQLEQRSWKDVPVTLRVCFPKPPENTQLGNVQIASVEGKGWVILDSTAQQ